MRDTSIDHDQGFVGFNVFKRQSDPDFLLAVPIVSPLPIVLSSGWEFSHAIQMRESLPAHFDMTAAQDAIGRDGYFVFDRGRGSSTPELKRSRRATVTPPRSAAWRSP